MTQEGEAAGILSEVEDGVVDELEEGEYVEGEDEELNATCEAEPRTRVTFSHKDLHAEQWDDSALIEAWDAAVREYQMYHSDQPPIGGKKKRKRPPQQYQQANPRSMTGPDVMEVDDTQQQNDVAEIERESAGQNHETVDNDSTTTQDYVETQRTSRLEDQTSYQNGVNSDGVDYPPGQCASCGVPTEMPTALPEDEDLANVMMAWYYAGYYSGIYAAKQKQRNQ
ncbi:hypothetical protein, variant [Spizellomyces punctatus DAOM BR117]|uniref:Survival Motor Neuron Gemin2-binding domain-containing protein n=1 Tax=Spizellomyces punctatus (strain DAOM BR117) TaxID=645134 RepID=A0A0L0HUT6_SPIPD|nr:hypothetical protein, variant [Spizellomyces punctatus DAOM BR117]KND04893.1 hypothetical protein, variant [Spizellomyces punctatus DAOM BR117]|eukprot:XP_016612932.1 hypothetical protein, variant [Spizellomyces punctatus DAOM BR117]